MVKSYCRFKRLYVYPTNGITEGLNWWYDQDKRSVYMDEGDYPMDTILRGNMYDNCIKYVSGPVQ